MIILILLLIIAGFLLFTTRNKGDVLINGNTPIKGHQQWFKKDSEISWKYNPDSKRWSSVGNPPTCPEPFTFPAPADVSLTTGVLYPGQIRGGDYKAHGGFRFDKLRTNDIEVRTPFDGRLFMAARHTTESNEIQYVLYFVNDCGFMFKFDHLLEITPKFMELIKDVHLAGNNDTRTTQISPTVFIPKGELVATKVGLKNNTFFDFGVYDLRKPNGVTYSTYMLTRFPNIYEHGGHAICWLENLEEPDRTTIKSLPGADGNMGKKSDYCK